MITAGDRRLLVFSYFQFGEIASVYFYDVQMQKETRQFRGANMLLGSLQNNDGDNCMNVYYFYADKNFAKVFTDGDELKNMINEQYDKPCECPIVMAAEQVVDSQEELQVVDLIDHSNSPTTTHSVSTPQVTNQPKFSRQWFDYHENTVTQFRQDEHDYFVVSNNQRDASKMAIYKVENPSQVTCVY